VRDTSKKKGKRNSKPNYKRSKVQKNDNESNCIYKQYGNNTKTKLHVTANENVRKKYK
jgi:hypothetical protein